ncbi:nucleoside-diphosphate-sugar epimerase [Streptomyces olivoverticillatus]|uniref:Nucleoside-diphosphate-sugar epimerase n=1 Tax=Streptomyces olivoverticillatus TaxID=66427 RepID=A0A7W7LPR8_9ACTN|nr:nucleoside-diphosphate-sugar epimerase [Streptomyces olivoverticillatus]
MDIDVSGGFVLVDENLAEANGALVFDTPKSHQKRLLQVGPALAKRLGRHLETLTGGDDALLFTTPGGKPLRYNQWRKAYFDPAVSAAGLTDVTPHDLRASHGTWVADHYGVMTAAHRLGHSNASVTTRHYARPVAGRDDQVAEAADSWLSGHESDPLAEFDGTTVAVTGGGGLIGSRIAVRLRAAGARVIAVGKLDAYPSEVYSDLFGIDTCHPDTVVGDVSDRAMMRHVIGQSDYVIHAAAMADVAACTREPHAALETNVHGTQVLLDEVARSGHIRRLCFTSSASVYGNGHSVELGEPVQFSEDDTASPLSVYGNTKLWGEHQVKITMEAAQVPYAVVRYFSVYGEPQTVKQGSHSWVVAWLAMRASLGLPLELNGGGYQVRDFVHVDDIAEGTIRALIAPGADGQVVNIGTGRPTTIRSIADRILMHYPDAALVERPLPPGDPMGGYADTRRMRRALGWKPQITMEDGVDRYVKWVNERPEATPEWMRQLAGASSLRVV